MDVNLRFGMQRDVSLIHKQIDNIDGFIVPANILAYQPAPTSVFLSSLPNKPYIIDPITYVFQGRKEAFYSDSGIFRPSLQQLCDRYHPSLAQLIQDLPYEGTLRVRDLPNIEELCNNNIIFQRDFVQSETESSRAKKYLERYTRSVPTEPRAIIPPYFTFNRIGDEWYNHSLDCANTSKTLLSDITTAPVICCRASVLDEASIGSIVEDYSDFELILLWIDDYEQTFVNSSDISNVRSLIRSLNKAGLSVETLYGGYLMLLYSFDGLSAISHGILYTQHKSTLFQKVSPGGPRDRYYISSFREFRSISQTDLILHKHPELICTCEICSTILDGNPDNIILLADEPELLRAHFLHARRSEVQSIIDSSPGEEKRVLIETYENYHASIEILPNPDAFVSHTNMRGLDYLNVWADSI